jgi:hypothetical protein
VIKNELERMWKEARLSQGLVLVISRREISEDHAGNGILILQSSNQYSHYTDWAIPASTARKHL